MPSMRDAIVLCGGAGTRLKGIADDGPKAMVRIAGRPFLELLLRQLRRNRFERVILAIGYKGDVIRGRYGESAFGISLAYSAESTPLGTGGAVRNAADLVESDAALVMNGDSYTDADLCKVMVGHRESKADVSVVVVSANRRDDCGSVQVDGLGRVVHFAEKQGSGSAEYVNSGIYVVSRSVLCEIPPGLPVSLEHELFPRWLGEGREIRALVHSGECMDIGTPERLRIAQKFLANVELEGIVPQSEDQLCM